MPTGTIVKDKQIPGNGGLGRPSTESGKTTTVAQVRSSPADEGSITFLISEETNMFHIPVFGNVAEETDKVNYQLATAIVTIDVDGVQLKKEMRVALPDGEVKKELARVLSELN